MRKCLFKDNFRRLSDCFFRTVPKVLFLSAYIINSKIVLLLEFEFFIYSLNMRPVRFTIFILFFAMFFFSALVDGQGQKKPLLSPAEMEKSMERGQKLYVQRCMACHQEDGSGVPRLNPPLIKTTYVLGSKSRLINIILNGLDEEIEIDGEFYSNPMPPFGSLMKDQEIADVLTYVRNSFQNKASAVTAEEVKKLRTGTK